MSALVNALLDISKLECGAIKPVIVDCPVRGFFRHLRASFEEEARAKGLTLIVMPELIVSDFHPASNISGIDVNSGATRARRVHDSGPSRDRRYFPASAPNGLS